MGDLSGKVAIVTGAGRGLGREEALQLAGQGAKVVINDIDLPDAQKAANEAVDKIKAAGGEAIAVLGDCANTADADALFAKTLQTYGDVNILVNNAGFCRDKAKCGEQVYGRLISTSSEASLYGSAGQPNYAAAKAGITAMTMGAAQLLIKYGITANVIMPRALTAMTDSGLTAQMFAAPEAGFHAFDPVNVAPLVGYLASAEAQHISGEAFVVWGNQVNIVQRPELSEPYCSSHGGQFELDDLHKVLGGYFTDDHRAVQDGYSMPAQ